MSNRNTALIPAAFSRDSLIPPEVNRYHSATFFFQKLSLGSGQNARGCMYEDHPVLNALLLQLRSLKDRYRLMPNELNRYRLVRQEQLIAEWAPAWNLAL